ncbi:MAG: DNA-directed RNA polymerase subunit omega [Cytophagales bacterium]
MAKKVTNNNVPTSIITRDLNKLETGTDNIYESIAIISRRARQISTKNKEELNSKLSEFASSIDNLEEVFENREQIEISKFYERLPKPSILAIEEYLEGKVMHRRPSES